MYFSTICSYLQYMRRYSLVIVTVIFGGLTIATTSVAWATPVSVPASQTVPPAANQLRLPQIYVAPLRLTSHSARDYKPAWSPDGTKIAFGSERDGNARLYTINADGSNLLQLTEDLVAPVEGDEPWSFESRPNWSPNGSQIAFVLSSCGCDNWLRSRTYNIYVINADGSNLQLIRTFALNPQWSPDSSMLLVEDAHSYTVPFGDFYVIKPDGSSPMRVSADNSFTLNPKWSPNANQIAFFTYSYQNSNGEVYVVNSDGSQLTNLTNHSAHDYFAAWSPNGSKITFGSERDGNSEIYVMDSNGGNVTNLTNNPATDYAAAWSPDGSKITFVSQRSDNPELFVMNADGSNLLSLTDDLSLERHASWSPDGSKLLLQSHYPNERLDVNALSEIYVMNADGSRKIQLTDTPAGTFVGDAVWSTNSRKIAFVDGYDIYIYVLKLE
jgi:Tol biopolymer transport system component